MLAVCLLSSCLPENNFISSLFLMDIFAEYEILFFFQDFMSFRNNVVPLFSDFHCFQCNSSCHVYYCVCTVPFFISCFQDFIFMFAFQQFEYDVCRCGYLSIYHPLDLFNLYYCVFYQSWEIFGYCFFQVLFLSHSPQPPTPKIYTFFSYASSITHKLNLLMLSHLSLNALFSPPTFPHFSIFFFPFCYSNWVISISLCSS